MAALPADQKAKLVMFESGVIYVAGRFFYIGSDTEDEFDLLRNKLIDYRYLDPIVTEKKRRLIIVNSLLETMTREERNLILEMKAAIIYRDGKFVLIGDKGELGSIQ